MRHAPLKVGRGKPRTSGAVRVPLLIGLLSLGLGAFVMSNTACTAVLGKDVDQCTKNSDCDRFQGNNFCRRSDNTCQPLTTADCPIAYGVKNDDSVYFGAIISLTGSYGQNGGYEPFEAALRTALDDFDKETNGLPPSATSGGRRRPLVGILCDDASAEDDNAAVLRSARHLVNTVRVPAIIGTPSTSTTVAMATEVTIPGGVFTISPSATGESITSLRDYGINQPAESGLLWRTAPSDTYQSQAIASYVKEKLIPLVRTKNSVPRGEVKILTFFRGDTYGEGLNTTFKESDAFKAGIQSEKYKEFNYGTGENSPSNADVQEQIKNYAPHIILAFGLGETPNFIIGQTESQWAAVTGASYRPYYVAGEGIAAADLKPLVAGKPDLQKRIIYTSPQLGTVENNVFNRFKDNFTYLVQAQYPPLVPRGNNILSTVGWFGLAGTYDAVYIVGYAITAASAGGTTGPVTGTSTALAMGKLLSGETADLYRRRIGPALNTLAAGGSVKINGASGPLNFDPKTGDVAADIPIACLDSEGSTQSSGLVYATVPKTITGEFDTTTCGYTP